MYFLFYPYPSSTVFLFVYEKAALLRKDKIRSTSSARVEPTKGIEPSTYSLPVRRIYNLVGLPAEALAQAGADERS